MTQQISQQIYELNLVNSKDKQWEVGYFLKQWNGLSENACNETDPKLQRWVRENIILARECRKQLLKRFGICFIGRHNMFHEDGTQYFLNEVNEN